MIRAVFRRDETGVTVRGHAEFGPHGEDIVCASVTSAVQLIANGITEVLGEQAAVTVAENEIAILLPEHSGQGATAFLQALHLHLDLLQQEYPKHIQVTFMEV